ncbi:MAG: tetratricopeptide repeat protein [Pseudobdellovibrionaceae bacterium]
MAAGPENNHLARNWLVKSSTKILGPFTREEVMSLLTRRQITIIDEVRQPEGRWNYIRENRYFKEVVKSLRYEQDHSKEDTMTSTSTIGTATITKTDPATGSDDFTKTPLTPAKSPPLPHQNSALKDVTPLDEQGPFSSAGTGTAKSYGTLSDQRVQNKIQKQNRLLRGILFTIAGAAILFVGFQYLRKGMKSEISYDQLLRSALNYKEIGLYQKSLQNYKKAISIKEPDLESQFQMVFLLINEDRQSLNGRRVIERMLQSEGLDRLQFINAYLGMALSYMMEGDLRQAEEYLQKTLGYDPNNEPAKTNQAVILLKKGNYAQALKSFESLSKADSPLYPLTLLGRSLALIEVSKSHADKEQLLKAIDEIRTYSSRSHFLRKELSLLMIYLNRLAEDQTGEMAAINTFLEEPQNLSRQYTRDLNVDWRNSEWDFLEKYCAELYNAPEGPPNMKAVRAVCLIESNRDLEAVKFLDESLAQAPKELTTLQAQSQYLWKLGRLKEAQLIFQNSDFKQDRIALYVQGEACLQAKDWSCAEAAYKLLSERDYGDVIAHYGLAQVSQARKDRARTQSEVKAGFEAETNFVPLIEIRDRLESL